MLRTPRTLDPTHKDTLMGRLRPMIEDTFHQMNNFRFDPENPVVRLHEATFGPDEIMAFMECMLTTHVTMGPKVRAFEKAFCNAHQFPYGVSNNSGSSANLLAIAALTNPALPGHLRPGDEVIVPALSWSTTVWPLIQHQLTPVIVDIDPVTMNINPEEVLKAVGPKTRALMIVPVYGNPCDMDALMQICKDKNLMLIEDCCEALGASYDNKAVGSFGRVGTFSFYFSHHMSTLEGGITVTNEPEINELMCILRAHGWVRDLEDKQKYLNQHPDIDPRFLFVNLGYNFRITEPQGAMGLVQLKKLPSFVVARRQNAHGWQNAFEEDKAILRVQEETPKGVHSWFGFPLTLTPKANFSSQEIRQYLEAQGIETRPMICGNIARQPALKMFDHRVVGDLVHADYVMNNSFSFGCHQFVDEAAHAYVTKKVKQFLAQKKKGA
jgi:CDP-4-dehydro-6-deoxyglucose reductase, E1